ncbi:MAG: selenocysteine-specific translation elongation factor [Thermoleophilia bacterium]
MASLLPLTLGTAGHIDHGKTALVTLLTGKNTDRLRVERERGISIELGYAELVLPSGRHLSVIDVPGHERFVRTMVAGATGIDLFLLVVAADDGVMPQTVEHVAILELLGVRRGVVAVTKTDLVDDDLLALVRDDVRAFLAGTTYGEAPLVNVSVRSGRGIAELLAALDELATAAATDSERRGGPARLPVDRSFALKGIGAIVTGTLWRGEIKAGDELQVQPGGKRVAVRSIEVHDTAATVAHAGQRVGLNLRGLSKEDVDRGQWLVAPAAGGAVVCSFDAWVRMVPGARPLRNGEHLRLHHGTGQVAARLLFLEPDRRELAGGAQVAAVVRLEDELAIEAHDRFILRLLSPAVTVAGGLILDVKPRRWHCRADHVAFVGALHDGDLIAAALALAAARGVAGIAEGDLISAGVSAGQFAATLTGLHRAGRLESLAAGATERRWFMLGTLDAARTAALAAAQRRGRERPQRPFMSAVELAALAPGLPGALLAALLGDLVAGGALIAGEGGYAAAGVGGALSAEQELLASELLARLTAAPLAPPTLAALADDLRRPRPELERLLEVLVRRGELVRVDKDLWFTAAAVADVRRQLEAALASDGQITIADFRDLVHTGRRNAQVLLELFDRQGLTRRQDDVRVARVRRTST